MIHRCLDGLIGFTAALVVTTGVVLLAAGPIMNLPGKVDSNNALVVTSVAAGTIGSQGRPIANLPGKVDANNALVVTMSGDVGPVDSVTIGTADTSGIRLDLESGELAVREGDDSAYAPIKSGTITLSGGGSLGGSQMQVAATGSFEHAGRTVIRAPAAGQYSFRNPSETNTYDLTLADWGTTLSAEAVSVADTAVLDGPASGVGILNISIGTDNRLCQFELTGTGAPVEIRDGGTFCSITKDTAASINVYFETDKYKIQNLRGGTRALRISLIGG